MQAIVTVAEADAQRKEPSSRNHVGGAQGKGDSKEEIARGKNKLFERM